MPHFFHCFSRRGCSIGFAGFFVLLLFGGSLPVSAQLKYVKDISATVKLAPEELVLNCVEQLRPEDAEEIKLELVEVPEVNIDSGKHIVGTLIYVGRVIQFSDLKALSQKIRPPQHLQMLNNRFKGRMEIEYRLEGVYRDDASMTAAGYKRLNQTRTVQVGGDENGGGIEVKVTSWYRHNSSEVASYGSIGAKLTLRSLPVDGNTKENWYKPRYQMAGPIEYALKNRPSGAEGRLISTTLEREFKERMDRKAEKIVSWLNQKRPLLSVEDLNTIGQKDVGETLESDVKEINFAYCGKPQTVTPHAVTRVDSSHVEYGGMDNTDQPFGD